MPLLTSVAAGTMASKRFISTNKTTTDKLKPKPVSQATHAVRLISDNAKNDKKNKSDAEGLGEERDAQEGGTNRRDGEAEDAWEDSDSEELDGMEKTGA